MKIYYELLNNKQDVDLEELKLVHQLESIKKYISIGDNFFDYVITNKNTFLYKVKLENELIGELYLEKDDLTLYLSILVKPEKQHLGIASKVLFDVINNKFNIDFNKILVSIDKDNVNSINLFKKMKFVQEKEIDDDLIEFVYYK